MSRGTMCDVSAHPETAKAIARSSFQARVDGNWHNAEIARFCKACWAKISKDEADEHHDTLCVECRAMRERDWLPAEAERDEMIAKARKRVEL